MERPVWDSINNALAVVGLASLILTGIRVVWSFFSGGSEWVDNITIQEYPAGTDFEDKEQFPGMSPQFYEPMPRSKYACPNLVRPQNTVLHNVVLKRAVFPENFDGTNETYREVMTFPRVSPDVPLCLVLERSELLPEYVLEWKTLYGGRARYYFYENRRNGDNSLHGVQYSYGPVARIRKILDLK